MNFNLVSPPPLCIFPAIIRKALTVQISACEREKFRLEMAGGILPAIKD